MSGTLCRCICGTGKNEQFELQRTFGSADFNIDVLDEIDEPPFQQPLLASGRLTYSMLQQPLRGSPIREGTLWYLSAEDQVDPVSFSLYVNGFSFKHDGIEASISLSPFVLVRNCKFQSGYSACLSDVKIFKVSLFAHSACYYFGIRSEDERWAEEERSRWVLDISRAVRLVTQSLFPPFRISCDPMQGVPGTQKRLMAGYIVHHDDVATASILYCELHAHQEDQAKVVLYENELCQIPVSEILISETAMCSEKIGINCSCFSVEDHQFSTRTLAERKLWLRAISNVRVKLQNRAPNPCEEELASFRAAIKEHLLTIRAALEGPGINHEASPVGSLHSATKPSQQCTQTMDPLLQQCHPRRPPHASWTHTMVVPPDPKSPDPSVSASGDANAKEAASEDGSKKLEATEPDGHEATKDLDNIKLELGHSKQFRAAPRATGRPCSVEAPTAPLPASQRPCASLELPKPGDG